MAGDVFFIYIALSWEGADKYNKYSLPIYCEECDVDSTCGSSSPDYYEIRDYWLRKFRPPPKPSSTGSSSSGKPKPPPNKKPTSSSSSKQKSAFKKKV